MKLFSDGCGVDCSMWICKWMPDGLRFLQSELVGVLFASCLDVLQPVTGFFSISAPKGCKGAMR